MGSLPPFIESPRDVYQYNRGRRRRRRGSVFDDYPFIESSRTHTGTSRVDGEQSRSVFDEYPFIESERHRGSDEFDPDGDGYDYKSAEENGIYADETGHWPSRVPGSGLILKGKNHPTFDKTIEEEERLGYKIRKIGGRYYSIPSLDIRPSRLPSRLE